MLTCCATADPTSHPGITADAAYIDIVWRMVVMACGLALTMATATESIMGAVPRAKAGVGSAVNDATRILGATLGVAVIGSVYASIYSSRLTAALPAQLPEGVADSAERSVGTAFGVAGQLREGGAVGLSQALHDAASSAFFDGFAVACLVAAGVAVLGAIFAAALLPAQPPQTATEGAEGDAPAAKALTSAGAHLRTGSPPSESRTPAAGGSK